MVHIWCEWHLGRPLQNADFWLLVLFLGLEAMNGLLPETIFLWF